MESINQDLTYPRLHQFECYGARIELKLPDHPTFRKGAVSLLPPERVACSDDFPFDAILQVTEVEDQKFVIAQDGEQVSQPSNLLETLSMLDNKLSAIIAFLAPDGVFVHAGCVAVGGQALVLPGSEFSGKSTLVRELVAAGADYYSEEFAVLHQDGTVTAFSRQVGLFGLESELGVEASQPLVQATAKPPVKIGLVAILAYNSNEKFGYRQLSPGQGALALLGHSAPVRDRPQEALHVARVVAESAPIYQGVRGEAADAAAALITLLQSQ